MTPLRNPGRPNGKVHPWAMLILIVGFAVLVVGIVRVGMNRSSAPGPAATPNDFSGQREPGPLRIVVTVPPLLWVVNGLAPEKTEITLLHPPGSACEGIELTPRQAVAVQNADLIVCVGFGLDRDATRQAHAASRPWRRIVSLESVVTGEEVVHSTHVHPGARGSEARHTVADPHAWLNPIVMQRFVTLVADEIIRAVLAGRPSVDLTGGDLKLAAQRLDEEAALRGPILARAGELRRTCLSIDEAYHRRLAAAAERPFITQHDAWKYLANRYNLEVAAVIQPTHGVEPTPGDIAAVTKSVRERGVNAIFVEPQLNRAVAERIAEVTGARILTLDPLGDGDWPEMMRRNLDVLVEGLGESPGGEPPAK